MNKCPGDIAQALVALAHVLGRHVVPPLLAALIALAAARGLLDQRLADDLVDRLSVSLSTMSTRAVCRLPPTRGNW